jgi:hypothetical protein
MEGCMTFAKARAEWLERKAEQSARNRGGVPATVKPLRRGTYASDAGIPASAPKTEPYRDTALLEMARGRPCLLLVPAACSQRTDTVVSAHSNLPEHGKGMARKADDCYSAWGCFACHSWLDQSKASAEQKLMVFIAAHARQVLAWRLIAMDPNEPERFRKAARRALEHLNATPLTEEM